MPLLIPIALSLISQAGLAQIIVDGSFENSTVPGFSAGWSQPTGPLIDNAAAVTLGTQLSPLPAFHGSKYAVLESSLGVLFETGVPASDVAAFMNTTTTALNALLPVDKQNPQIVQNGSALRTTFSLQPSDLQFGNATLSFAWAFLTTEEAAGKNSPASADASFYSLKTPSTTSLFNLVDNFDPTVGDLTVSYGGTYSRGKSSGGLVWQQASLTLSQPGTYQLAFGVFDVEIDYDSQSALLIDNVQVVTPVPEPWAWSAMTGVSLLGFAWARRRRQATVVPAAEQS